MSKKLTKKERAALARNKLNKTEKLENGNTRSTSWVKVAHEWVQISCTFDDKGNMVDCNEEFRKLLKRSYNHNTHVSHQPHPGASTPSDDPRPQTGNNPDSHIPPSSSIQLKQ